MSCSSMIESSSHSNKDRRELVGGYRLSPFEKIPPIGVCVEYVPRPPPQRSKCEDDQQINCSPSMKNPRLKRFVSEKKEDQFIEIRIHLFDGRKLEKKFHLNDRIIDVMKFVQSEEKDLPEQFYFSSSDRPKRQFLDFNLTLAQAQLQNRSVLFLDRP